MKAIVLGCHARDCAINNAADDPKAWFKAAVALARLNAPLAGKPWAPTCPECGADDRVQDRKQWRGRHTLRCEWLKVSRGHKDAPTKTEVREICEWMIRWGLQPDNYWLHFAGMTGPTFEIPVAEREP